MTESTEHTEAAWTGPRGTLTEGKLLALFREIVLATALLAILPLELQAQDLGFLEVQGIDSGLAEIHLSSELWTEPRRRELATDPVLFELPAGEYSLKVTKEGFRSFSATVTVVVDEVSIVRPLLSPILTEVRIVHLLPAEVPYRLGTRSGVTPATVRVPIGEQVILVDDIAICLRFRRDSTAYVRIRQGNLEEVRGATECEFLPQSVLVPPSPRNMTIPLGDVELRGKKVEIWVFVDELGRVVADSTRLEPPASSEELNRRLIREAAEWLFSPAQQNGRAVSAWFPFLIGR